VCCPQSGVCGWSAGAGRGRGRAAAGANQPRTLWAPFAKPVARTLRGARFRGSGPNVKAHEPAHAARRSLIGFGVGRSIFVGVRTPGPPRWRDVRPTERFAGHGGTDTGILPVKHYDAASGSADGATNAGPIPLAGGEVALGAISRTSGQSPTTHDTLYAVATTLFLAALPCALIGAARGSSGRSTGR